MNDPAAAALFQRLVASERERQEEKWATSHDGLPVDAYLVALGEEFGEVCRAHIEGRRFALARELVQVAAVCSRIFETFALQEETDA